MKITEVPVYNEDGTVKLTVVLGENELQTLLQFGMNMAVAMGIAGSMGIDIDDDMEEGVYDD